MAFRKKSATPPPPPPPPRTLFEKIWDGHVVHRQDDGTCVLYIDRHLVHEVTSPQAFEGLRMANRPVRRTDATIAVADHAGRRGRHGRGIADPGRDAREERRRLPRALLRHERPAPRHRARDRPRA